MGSQKPSNLQSSPKCWHDISNINIYIQLTYTPQMVGSIYPIQIYIFINVHAHPCARRAHRNPPTYSHPPSVGMIYPISTYIYFHKCTLQTLCPKGTQKPSNLQSSPKCWHDISNINIYIQLTYTPQIIGSIYPIQIYIFINVHSKPCARRANRNPSTYSHPLSVGMIYPISTYIFN